MSKTTSTETTVKPASRFSARSITATLVAGMIGIVIAGAASQLVDKVSGKVHDKINPSTESE